MNNLYVKCIIKFLLCGVLFFNTSSSFAQTENWNDTLSSILKSSKTDSAKIFLIGDKAITLKNKVNPVAVNFVKEQFQLAVKTKNAGLISYSYYTTVVINLGKVSYDSLFQLTDSSIVFAKRGNSLLMLLRSHRIKGQLLLLVSKNDEAIEYMKEAVVYAKKLNNPLETARTIHTLANIEDTKGNKKEALKYYLEALEYFEANPDFNSLPVLYTKVGNIFLWELNYEKSLYYFTKNVAFCEKNSLQALPTAHICIGTWNYQKEFLQEALSAYAKAEEAMIRLKYFNETFAVYSNRATIYQKLNQTDSAKKYFKETISLVEEGHVTGYKGRVFLNYATFISLQGEHDTAITYIDKALVYAEQENDRDAIPEILKVKAEILSKKKDFEKALQVYRETIEIKDSLNKINKEESLNDLLVKYETDKKQHEIIALQFDQAQKELMLSKQTQQLIQSQSESEKRNAELQLMSQTQQIRDLELKQKSEQLWGQQLRNAEKTEQINLLEKNSELNSSLAEKQKSQRNALILSTVLFLALAGMFFYQSQNRRKTSLLLAEKNKIIEQEKFRAQKSEQFKSSFLANMSHEIRTPMNAIHGITNVLVEKNKDTEQQKLLQVIKNSSNDLLVIINDILDLSKIESGKLNIERARFSLDSCLQTVTNTFKQKAFEKNIDLIVEKEKNTPDYLLGDSTRLNQVLINLVGNAIKFTEKGFVKLEIGDLKMTKPNTLISNLQFQISDSGIGIPHEKIATIFENFSQADESITRRFGGTGLGLSISKNLVALMGGKIEVQSTVGKGSVFSFSIPMEVSKENISEKISADNLSDKAGILNGIKILLAEDNEYNRLVATETVSMLIDNAKIDSAENGMIALELLKKNKYDVVLMDVQMPVMDGIAATKNIRASTNGIKDITIIAITANASKEERERCIQAGMNAYISKPFEPEELIARLLDYKKS